ncbi:hypothetical protein A6J39_006985 [Legionella anisa]|uniref:Uncharacterized protein n=1 Tax=Legionella anisa TaxID=28082 RepID=A0AAX0WSR8_9GAMM|nr:hypothetical protein DLD14_15155 [Legionella anisa]PNL60978.1 hypothetical protein A6J39_006985 [Legionella anisa]
MENAKKIFKLVADTIVYPVIYSRVLSLRLLLGLLYPECSKGKTIGLSVLIQLGFRFIAPRLQ